MHVIRRGSFIDVMFPGNWCSHRLFVPPLTAFELSFVGMDAGSEKKPQFLLPVGVSISVHEVQTILGTETVRIIT